MWRPYLAAFLLAALLCGGFAAQHYACRAAEQLASLTPLSLEEAQKDRALERAYQAYQAKTPLFSTLYVHSSLEEIDLSFESCFASLEAEAPEEYWRQARRLAYLLRRLPEADQPTIENIL